ncbi:hypothetical protein [Nocardioides daejeonensis]|uniref:hypothetical protein n=1 Tax=Nocardioides daejeonensis TaxID=1046556 RepID=UPI000D7451D0|nr:hypothetical protein [Nocardioides daejeonensis]
MRKPPGSIVVALLVALVGITMIGFGISRSAGEYAWPDDTSVTADGKPHEVRTTNGSVWIWSNEADGADASTCTATMTDGSPIRVQALRERVKRPGKLGDYVSRMEFNSYEDTALVTCQPSAGGSDELVVYAEPAPRLILFAGLDPWTFRGGLVTLLGGLIYLGGALVRRANRTAALRQQDAE